MRIRTGLAVGVAGAAAVALTAQAFGMPGRDAFELAAIAAASAGAAGALGMGVLAALRRRSIGAQVAVVALASVLAVGAGAMASARAMFISAHDLDSLLVILLAAGTVGAMVAFLLGYRVSAASRRLGELARSIGEGKRGEAEPTPPTAEFGALARELEEMSERLAEARDHERALDASRRELIAWVSHDIRTPLAGLRAMAEALEDGLIQDGPTLDRYYRALRVETERLAHLVDELFEISVINAGALRLQMEHASLSDLVSDAISSASASAHARNVRVEGQVNGTAPELDLAPPQVARVIRNLIDNAVRHTPSDGSVWIETGLREGLAYLSVADECGGIPAAELPRVFDASFRGETARTPVPNGGAGLGLAIARGIVEAHHGDITVRNEGRGCRFTVRLPLRQPASPVPG